MIVIQSIGFAVCALMCVYFIFSVITDYQWRQSLVKPWVHIGLGVGLTLLTGWAAYALYPWGA